MTLSFVEVKFSGQDIGLEESRIDRLVMFSAIVNPAKFFLQYFQGFRFYIRDVVQNMDQFDPLNDPVLQCIDPMKLRKCL